MDNYSGGVSERLRTRSKEVNISQADICRATGAAKSTVNAWFTGSSIPRGNYAKKVCSMLRCSMDWLMAGKGSASVSNEEQFFGALSSTWDSQVKGINTEYVRVPFLSEINNDFPEKFSIVPSTVLTNVSKPDQVFCFTVNTQSSSPLIKEGDLCVINGAINQVIDSGSFYLIKHASGSAIYKVYIEIDGCLVLVDSERGSETKVCNEQKSSLLIQGKVIYCSGFM